MSLGTPENSAIQKLSIIIIIIVIVVETGGTSQINGNIRMYIFTRMLFD